MKRLLCFFTVAILAGCSASSDMVSKDDILNALEEADVEVVSVTDEDPDDSGMVPGGYQRHFSIVLEEVAPSGGQFFICDEAATCDKVKQYFDSLANLTGPHRYQSESGLVVAQLNSEVSQETGDRVAAVLKGM